MSALTVAQRECLSFIIAHDASHGCIPTYQEIGEGIGLKSKSGIHRLITALEERGFIRRLPAHARSIEILFDENGAPRSEATVRLLAIENAALRAQVAELAKRVTAEGEVR